MDNVHNVKDAIPKILTFLDNYKWIIDSYISDFFLKSLHQRLPPSWWKVLSSLQPEELASLLYRDTWKSSKMWPLSLLAFRKVVTGLPLQRDTLLENYCEMDWEKEFEASLLKAVYQNGASYFTGAVPNIKNGQLRGLEHCYRRHVKPKKQHEIIKLAELIESLCQSSFCDHVVDVGAGQGHLARLLAFGHGISVTTLEAVSCHTPKAQKYDREVIHDMMKGRKLLSDTKEKRLPVDVSGSLAEPSHVVAMITPNMSPEDFLSILHLKQACNIDGDIKTNYQTQNHIDDSLRSVSHTIDAQIQENYDVAAIGSISTHHKPSSADDDGSPVECKLSTANNRNQMEHRSLVVNHCDTHMEATSDRAYENNLSKQYTSSKTNGNERGIQHELCMVDDSDSLKKNRYGTINDNDSDTVSQQRLDTADASANFVLTGLHACGDLTPTMIRVFVQCPQAVGLVSVGCCYMKLSTDCDDKSDVDQEVAGYPMSNFVKMLPGHQLTYEAREMACHFIDCYHDRLKCNLPQLRCHAYRAALQEIIEQKDPSLKHGSIKVSVKHTEDLPFTQYASMALKRLKLSEDLTPEQLVIANSRLKQWNHVVAFYTLRLSLAPLVEMVLLLDRALYLAENGIRCKVLPVFDPKLSPRNFVLLARK